MGLSASAAISPPARAATGRVRAQRWAQRLYREAVADPEVLDGFRSCYNRISFTNAAVALKRVLGRYGYDTETELALARSLEQLGSYASAAQAYSQVLAHEPRRTETRVAHRRAERLAAASRALASGGGVTQLVDAGMIAGHSSYLALSFSGDELQAPHWAGGLFLVREGDPEAECVWQDEGEPRADLELPDPVWGRKVRNLVGMDVFLARLSPASVSQPLFGLVAQSPMAGGAESQAIVFRRTGTRLERLWAVGGTLAVGFSDRDHDGWSEINVWDEVGFDMCHASQPRWTDIYAWNGTNYVEANRRFRRTFREVRDDLDSIRTEFPADPDVIAHLGRIHEMEGRSSAATAAYQQAIVECRRRASRPYGDSARELLHETEARLNRLQGRRPIRQATYRRLSRS